MSPESYIHKTFSFLREMKLKVKNQSKNSTNDKIMKQKDQY